MLFLIASSFEVVGIGLIGLYVAIITGAQNLPSAAEKWLNIIKNLLGVDSTLMVLSGSLVALFLFKAVISIFVQRSIRKFSYTQLHRMRTDLMRSYQKIPYSKFSVKNTSEYVRNIQDLTITFSRRVATVGLKSTCDLITGVAIFSVLAWVSWEALSILLVLFVFVVLVYDRIVRRPVQRYGKKINRLVAAISQAVIDGISGFKEVRILQKEKYFYNKLESSSLELSKALTDSETLNLAPRYFIEFLMITFVVMVVIIHFSLGDDPAEVVPILTVFAAAAVRLIPTINSLSNALLQFRFSRNAVSLLYNDLAEIQIQGLGAPEAASDKASTAKAPSGNTPFDSIELKSVSFSYPEREQKILNSVSFKIKEGETIGIVGPSGAGKTTLIDVLLGLLEPTSGKILLNGKPLAENLSRWYGQVAYIPQEMFLTGDSLLGNVALSDPEFVDMQRVEKSLDKAKLGDVVKNLPKGLYTSVGDKGVRLSGGQRQRVALARAFYHDKQVIVMDEATSALDSKTELDISNEIGRLKGNMTLLIVAHRMTTLKNCDRILKLDAGNLIECGDYNDYLAVSGNAKLSP